VNRSGPARWAPAECSSARIGHAGVGYTHLMCRNIQQLRGAEPPATEAEIRDAALQFVRKVSGYRKPSAANAPAFEAAVDEVAEAVRRLLAGLTPGAASKPVALLQRRRAAAGSSTRGD
jgi:hypothetical protein